MFGHHSSWLVAMTVILVGILVALPFQLETPPESADEIDFSHLTDGLIWQEDGASLQPADVDTFRRNRSFPFHQDDQVTMAAATDMAGLQPPPRMEAKYGGLAERHAIQHTGPPSGTSPRRDLEPEHPGRRPDELFAQRDGSRGLQDNSAAGRLSRESSSMYPTAAGPSQPQVSGRVTLSARNDLPVTPSRMHRIVDGDTLPSLAVRYLGDANRADEIFAANRQWLASPELLPLGKQLRIPLATPTASDRDTSTRLAPLTPPRGRPAADR
jgi:hypothetical protein